MDVLVIGGSVFLGRAVVAEALAAGHRVTVFNRGLSAATVPGATAPAATAPGALPAGVEHIRGDRTVDADLAQLQGRRFDLVVDTCGYAPAEVARSAEVLEPVAGHYAFVSTISVYPGWPVERRYADAGVFDGDPDATDDTVPADLDAAQRYGWLKVGCERAVDRAFGVARSSLLRAGVIVGPDDSAIGRLPWWLDRFARGGEVLVPGAPPDPIALIDARDLARFALTGAAGTFQCGGPAGRDTWAGFVDALAAVTGSDAHPTWVDGAWLAQQDVQPWSQVPLWTGSRGTAGTWAHDNAAAQGAGLAWRPLADTVRDTWGWQHRLDGWRPTDGAPGLEPHRERELLAAWHAR